jgi:hypothetical protein
LAELVHPAMSRAPVAGESRRLEVLIGKVENGKAENGKAENDKAEAAAS